MPTANKTISQVLEEFPSDQEVRLSPKTLSKYEGILSLFESYLESYWPGHDQEEYNHITGQGGTFCGSFGPEEIPGGYGEFLGYFMSRKVMCGKDTMKAAGTVTKKLAKWLAEKGYVEDILPTHKSGHKRRRGICLLPKTCLICWRNTWRQTLHIPTKTKSRITFGSRRSSRVSSGWSH